MKHLNQFVHLPRSAGKSFIQKQKSQFECEKEKSNFGHQLHIGSYTLDDLLMTPATYTKDNITSRSTLLINTSLCDFSKVIEDFTVGFTCIYCRKRQELFTVSQLTKLAYSSQRTAVIQGNCNACHKKTRMSTHNLFKRTLQAYTQQPIETLPNNLDGIIHMLLEYIEFYKTLTDTSTKDVLSYDDGISDTSAYTALNKYTNSLIKRIK